MREIEKGRRGEQREQKQEKQWIYTVPLAYAGW